jgi:hypothetical protein
MKKKNDFTLEEQLAVKDALTTEFALQEKRVSKSWLDIVDCEPEPDNPDHWDYLLYMEDKCYINLKFFPLITIEPTHTTSYDMGKINYKKDMTPADVVKYIRNILDE